MRSGVSVVLVAMFLALFAFPSVTQVASSGGSPHLLWVTDFYDAPLIDAGDAGILNLITTVNKHMHDGTSNKDWYQYDFQVQTVPGEELYNNGWETADHFAKFTFGCYGRQFTYYEPSNSDGYTSSVHTIAVTISSTGAGVTISQSWTYTAPWIKVIDHSNYAIQKIEWEHDFNEQNDDNGPSENTHNAKPGLVVKPNQNLATCVQGDIRVSYGQARWYGWVYVGYFTASPWLSTVRYGDTH